jgi:hypothetical protein
MAENHHSYSGCVLAAVEAIRFLLRACHTVAARVIAHLIKEKDE